MKKRIVALFCVILCLLQCSCFGIENSAKINEQKQLIKQDFAQFHNGNNVAICCVENIYFDTNVLHLDESMGLASDIILFEQANGGYWFEKDKVYFSTTRADQYLSRSYSFLIYECDISGNNVNVVYERNNYKFFPRAVANEGIFYIYYDTEHYDLDSSSQQIDTYNMRSEEYAVDIMQHEDFYEYDYWQMSFSERVYDKQDYFEISIEGEDENIIIDDAFMDSTIYADVMNKYGYTCWQWSIVDGHILLSYWLSADVGWEDEAFVLFEYDKENHTLVYQLSNFWPIGEPEYYLYVK